MSTAATNGCCAQKSVPTAVMPGGKTAFRNAVPGWLGGPHDRIAPVPVLSTGDCIDARPAPRTVTMPEPNGPVPDVKKLMPDVVRPGFGNSANPLFGAIPSKLRVFRLALAVVKEGRALKTVIVAPCAAVTHRARIARKEQAMLPLRI